MPFASSGFVTSRLLPVPVFYPILASSITQKQYCQIRMFLSCPQYRTHQPYVGSTDSSERTSKRMLAELELLSKSIDDDCLDIRGRRIDSWNPNIMRIRQTPIESIPTELLIRIFELCEPNAKIGFNLAHTCRLWMRIAAVVPSLWTSIVVNSKIGDQDFKSSLSLLTTQLDRAKGQLLDVYWTYDVKSLQLSSSVQFIRDNAPFHRWRSGSIYIHSYDQYRDYDIVSPNEAFTNLEKWTIKRWTTERWEGGRLPKRIFNIKSTPKLQSLDLSDVHDENWTRGLGDFTPLIVQATHLTLPRRGLQYRDYKLPANITHLTATEHSGHNYPHVQSYNLFECKFNPTKRIDLRSLTTFVVDSIDVGCKVILPVLRDMEFRELKLRKESSLEAPHLENLRVITNPDTIEYEYQSSFGRAMSHLGYHIWPSKTISIDAILSINDIVKLITRHPNIETVNFSFKNPFAAKQMLDFLAGLYRQPERYTPPNSQGVCRSLKNVGLHFEWPIPDGTLWKECASRVLRNRMKQFSLVSLWVSSKEGLLPLIENGHLVDGAHSSQSSDAQSVNLRRCWIKGIPVKVLLDIFYFCEPGVHARLVLTHTCRRWMKIAEAVPYLWTSIVIHCRLSDRGFKGSLSLLTMQLNRARGNLLDVFWIHHAQSSRNGIIDRFIHDNAPFSRWRTLSVEVHSMDPLHPKSGWPHDAFINLKALTIKCGRISLPLGIITNLQMLDLAGSQGLGYLPRLRHSSDIILPGYEIFYQLPPNITHLRVTSRSGHIFPHLLCYDLFECKFDSIKNINLRNLSTFIADSIEVACHVTLPALRNIEFRVLKLHEDSSLEAPQLENLKVIPDLDPVDLGTRATFSSTMQHPGYNLWPTKTVIMGIHLSIEEIVVLLTRCRSIEAVSFSFREPLAAELMLNMLARFYPNPPRCMIPNSQGMCSELKEASLNFGWRICEVAFWKNHAARLVENRLKKLPLVSVYGLWEGENLSVQLL